MTHDPRHPTSLRLRSGRKSNEVRRTRGETRTEPRASPEDPVEEGGVGSLSRERHIDSSRLSVRVVPGTS